MIIKNVTGKTVLKKTYTSIDKINFEIEEAPGIYMIELFTPKGQTTKLKVVKQ